jgi:3-methyl-2-oxobutanoate hydroxymethyltransferase
MSTHAITRRFTHVDLAKMRAADEKIAVLTCYDASFAQLCDAAAVEVLLIGDSLGMVLQGHDSTLPVTVDDIVYHTAAVARGAQRALVAADLPWASYQESPAQAYRNAARLMAAGAQMVKLEGGAEMAETTAFLSQRGIPVWAHVGLTPQYVHTLGGYRVQGRGDAAARVLADAKAHAAAGAVMLLLEAIPADLAADITRETGLPTIGIGAGKDCSGQVLVLHDMLDVTPGKKARFVRNFMAGQTSIAAAVVAYVAAVKDGNFPGPEHCY